ncbi:MAG: hypothetical protein HGA67_00335 [Candidatus Yonathbacteria bacterium]|nr:hypothetical protein [Candidatus Yonathbacteria bacterium]
MSLKQLLLKKTLASQLKGVPPEQQEMILKVVEENPELFQKIAMEMQAEMKKGKDQMAAAMTIMPKYQAELAKLMK